MDWKARIALLTVAAVALQMGVAQAQRRSQDDEPGASVAGPPDYEVQPGDMLQVSVWREADLNQAVLVRPDGGFSFPLAGDMTAIGKTVEELRVEITQRLTRFIPEPVVTVSITQINGNKIYVIGQVARAGEYVVNPRVDVMQALSMAGGMTPFAALDDIYVLRRNNGEQIRLPFRFSDVSRGRNLEQNVMLQSGDVVVVP
jgi:polysaccharide export outer membrane protein